MAHISVVIPVFKNEDSLLELYRRLTSTLEGISRDFEIIMVEDCGGDGSWDVINKIARSDRRVKGIQFSRNFGQHYGITAGLDLSSADWTVVMDADLQDRPEEIPRLYQKAQEGFDVVLARRKSRKHPFAKRLLSGLFYRVFDYLTSLDCDSQVGNFRIVSRKVVENFRRMRENLRFFSGLVDWMGFPTSYIDIEHDKRCEGKTTYTFGKLIKLAGDAIIAYSDKPLKLAITVGFAMSFFSFLYGAYVVALAVLYGSPVMGWSSLIASLYFIGGVIIGILGIIGIYLGKTFDEAKKRPLYIVKASTFDEKSN